MTNKTFLSYIKIFVDSGLLEMRKPGKQYLFIVKAGVKYAGAAILKAFRGMATNFSTCKRYIPYIVLNKDIKSSIMSSMGGGFRRIMDVFKENRAQEVAQLASERDDTGYGWEGRRKIGINSERQESGMEPRPWSMPLGPPTSAVAPTNSVPHDNRPVVPMWRPPQPKVVTDANRAYGAKIMEGLRRQLGLPGSAQ